MCTETKDRCPFILKWRVSKTEERNASLKKSGSNKTAMFSNQLLSNIFSSNWKGTPFATGSRGIFFFSVQKCISEMCPCLTFIKLRGPRRWQMSFITLKAQHIFCDNLFHLRNGICIWGVGGSGPESRFLSCLLVSVTLVHKSSPYFRSGRK